MNTLTRDRAHQLMTDVAAAMPFPVETADLGGRFTLQIDLGARPNADGTPAADAEHDRAGIDHADLAETYGGEHKAPVWWFETWAGGTDRQAFSALGPDTDPADVAAWIAEQARAAGSPAVPAVPRRRPAMDHLTRRVAEINRARLNDAERALRGMTVHGELKEGGHEVWVTPHAVSIRTRTTLGEHVMLSPNQAIVTAHKDPHRTVLTVEFHTPRAGAGSEPYVRTRHFKTGAGAAKAIGKHIAHLVETGMHTEAGRPAATPAGEGTTPPSGAPTTSTRVAVPELEEGDVVRLAGGVIVHIDGPARTYPGNSGRTAYTFPAHIINAADLKYADGKYRWPLPSEIPDDQWPVQGNELAHVERIESGQRARRAVEG